MVSANQLQSTAKARAARARLADERALALAPIVARLDPDGTASHNALARLLAAEGVPTPGGAGQWSAAVVARLRKRLEAVGGIFAWHGPRTRRLPAREEFRHSVANHGGRDMDDLLRDLLELVDMLAAVAVTPGEPGFQAARVVAGLIVAGAGLVAATSLLQFYIFAIEIMGACAREIREMAHEFRDWIRRRQ